MKRIITKLFSSVLTLALFGCSMAEMEVHDSAQMILEDEHSVFPKPELRKSLQTNFLQTGWYNISDTVNGYQRVLYRSDEEYFVDKQEILGAKNIIGFEIYESNAGSKHFGLAMRFDDFGTKAWSIATERAIFKQLAFILNDTLLHVATINSRITSGVAAINREIYSKQELERFQSSIQQTKK
jgi:preprotein translocase subunit SecD